MSRFARLNPERVLSDAMLDGRRKGRWFEQLGIDEARYRLNGAQTQFLVDGWVSDEGEKAFGPTPLTMLHQAGACGNKSRRGAGRPCVVHNPSDHGMRGWPLIWDAQQSRMRRLCPHDVEHPDPDDATYWADVVGEDPEWHKHECCEACFPDRRCFTRKMTGSIIEPPVESSRQFVWR